MAITLIEGVITLTDVVRKVFPLWLMWVVGENLRG